jgi:hypothetical protein
VGHREIHDDAALADGFGVHVPNGCTYTAMAFSALVEELNGMITRRNISYKPSEVPSRRG